MILNIYLFYFLLCSTKIYVSNSFLTYFKNGRLSHNNKNKQSTRVFMLSNPKKNYHFSQRYTEELLERIQ